MARKASKDYTECDTSTGVSASQPARKSRRKNGTESSGRVQEVPRLAVEPQDQAVQALVRSLLEKAEKAQNDPRRFKVYRDDPIGFCRDVLGFKAWSEDAPDQPGLTPRQCEILTAATTERRITIKSGHGTGKSFVLAILTVWWTLAREGLVVTTASTWEQVERVLWREIKKLVSGALVKLPGEVFNTEYRISPEWYAIGLSTNNPTAFQGSHHSDLLVLVDEAPGVGEEIHEAIASLAVGEQNLIVMVGNPTSASGTFYESFRKSGWHRIHMSCLDHPNVLLGREVIPGAVTRIWVEEAEQKWGKDSPIFASRVLGEFPTGGSNTVIPVGWCDRAMDVPRYLSAKTEKLESLDPVIVAVDIARYGDNKCVLCVRKGDTVMELRSWGQLSTMETVGLIVQAHQEWDAQQIVVDEVGLGAGVLDRLLEQDLPAYGYHSGRTASGKTLFRNRRSEMWWIFRELMEKDEIRLPADEDLRADLIAPLYSINSTGRIEVERKEEMKSRGVESPDFADAVIMAWSVEPWQIAAQPGDRISLGRDATLILHKDEYGNMANGQGPMAQLSQGF